LARKKEVRKGLTYGAFSTQRKNAQARNIAFNFTYDTWLAWWEQALSTLGPDAKRGLRLGEYMMCRFKDQGVYEPGNVYAGTCAQNQHDIAPDKRPSSENMKARWAAYKAAGGACWLEDKRGDAHPKSKAVITPAGRFGSIALAAEAYNITRQGGFYKVKRGEWKLE